MQNKISLYKKLHRIQNEVQIRKDGKGYNYKYATLDSVCQAIQPICIKEEILWYHSFENGQDITCHIVDCNTGEEITSSITMPAPKEIVNASGKVQATVYQTAGGGITYYRRYTLLAILGLLTDEDVDASPNLLATPEVMSFLLEKADASMLQSAIKNQVMVGNQQSFNLTNEQTDELRARLKSLTTKVEVSQPTQPTVKSEPTPQVQPTQLTQVAGNQKYIQMVKAKYTEEVDFNSYVSSIINLYELNSIDEITQEQIANQLKLLN